MSAIELFSSCLCPFAHRTRLALGEKGIVFSYTEIDLDNKPAWFKDVSLYARVPALRHGPLTLCESAVINEYLEDLFPTPPLLPEDPGRRAQARVFIDFANTRFVQSFGKLLRGATVGEQEQGRREFDDALAFIETEGLEKLAGGGPYFLGPQVSLVDYTFYPWFERLPVLAHYRDYKLPARPRLTRWIEAVSARPAVRAIASPPELYVERYARFVKPVEGVPVVRPAVERTTRN